MTKKLKRKVIPVSGNLAEDSDDAIEALRTNPYLYERGRQIVCLSPVDGRTEISPVSLATLREELSRVVRFQEPTRKGGNVLTDVIPPKAIAEAILKRSTWGLRKITGVIQAPTLRLNGTIVQNPGFDEESGCFYAPSTNYPEIPDCPSVEDARAALEILKEPFVDFPFINEAHRSVALATVLTILARSFILGAVPGIAIDATTPGTGKTRLTDIISALTTGHYAPRRGLPADNTEMEKTLGMYALTSPPLICFDNIERKVGGEALNVVLTAADVYEARVLGKSKKISVPWRTVIMFTGNNLDFYGDIFRRVLHCRMETDMEHPEERTGFRHAQPEWTFNHRPKLVGAALTLLRAWVVAGRPLGGVERWDGGFEGWSAIIPPALVFAGGANPLEARLRDTSTIDDSFRALTLLVGVNGLAKLDPTGEGISTREIVRNLYPVDEYNRLLPISSGGHNALREALELLIKPPPGRQPDHVKLGYMFRGLKGRPCGGKKLVNTISRTRAATWKVVDVDE